MTSAGGTLFQPARSGMKLISALLRKWRSPSPRLRSQDLLSVPYESAFVGRAKASLSGTLLSVNSTFAAILGRSADDLVGHDIAAFTHPDDRAADTRQFARAVAGEIDGFQCEKRYIRPDGEVRWAVVSVAIAHDDRGAPVHAIADVLDVTERKRTEDALRASESRAAEERDRAQSYLQVAGVMLLVLDGEGTIATINQRGAEILGYSRPEDLVGRNWFEIAVPEQCRAEVREVYLALLAQAPEAPAAYENPIVRADGTERLIAWRNTILRGPSGEVVGTLSSGDDITERGEAEDALRESHRLAGDDAQRVQLALAAGAIIGTWFWDLPRDRFTVDEPFATAFGLDPALGRDGLSLQQVIETVHPDDRAGLIDAIDQAIARGGPYAHQYRVRRRNGRYHWIEANGRVDHGPDGVPLSFPGVLIDVEHRRAAEAERERDQAMLQAFIEAVPGVVYAKDRDGRMLVANRGTQELVGKPLGELIGRTDAEFLDDAAQAGAVMANDRRIRAQGVAEQVEEEVSFPDGSKAVWLSTKAPFRDTAGEVIGLIGSSVDITDRKRTETRLRESEEKYRRLFDNLWTPPAAI